MGLTVHQITMILSDGWCFTVWYLFCASAEPEFLNPLRWPLTSRETWLGVRRRLAKRWVLGELGCTGYLGLFKVIFYFPNGKSTIWGIYSEYFLFFGHPLSKSKVMYWWPLVAKIWWEFSAPKIRAHKKLFGWAIQGWTWEFCWNCG